MPNGKKEKERRKEKMVNLNLLKGKIYENGYTYTNYLKMLGIDYTTFNRQAKNGKLPMITIKKIRSTLKLTNEDVFTIFFEKELA